MELFDFLITKLADGKPKENTYVLKLFEMLNTVLSTELYASLLSPKKWEGK